MLKNQSHLFNLPDDVTYLNCAYMSPMLKSVSEIGKRAIVQRKTQQKFFLDIFLN